MFNKLARRGKKKIKIVKCCFNKNTWPLFPKSHFWDVASNLMWLLMFTFDAQFFCLSAEQNAPPANCLPAGGAFFSADYTILYYRLLSVTRKFPRNNVGSKGVTVLLVSPGGEGGQGSSTPRQRPPLRRQGRSGGFVPRGGGSSSGPPWDGDSAWSQHSVCHLPWCQRE